MIVSLTAFGQDLITTTEGQTIKAKVLEIGLDEIKYKKYENLEGPTYTMVKSKVLVIYYENGTTELFGNKSNIVEQEEIANAISNPCETSPRGIISYNIGANLPVGKFGLIYEGTEAGYALPFVTIEFNLVRHIGESSFDFCASSRGNVFSADQTFLGYGIDADVTRGPWSLSGTMVGGQYNYSINNREKVSARVMTGLVAATKSEMMVEKPTYWFKEERVSVFTPTILVGCGMSANTKKNLVLLLNLDFQRAYPTFNSIESVWNNGMRTWDTWSQPMSFLSLTGGIGVNFN
ncbi:MAG: hypothetical protein O3A86_07475 [Bacteroidetes bacterium]|nr:hypothetical protein [Bacteroidota bacterium]